MFWNKILIKPLGDNRISIKDEENVIKPNIHAYFTNTKLTTIHMDDEDKSTIYVILKIIGFYSIRHNKGLKSGKTKDALYNVPKAIAKIRSPPLQAIGNIENVYDDLQGEGVKTIIHSNVIVIFTRLEILLGSRLSSHTNTLKEASNLISELYKRGEIQNEEPSRNSINKFFTL